ncbi:hypothetical protein SAMN06265182_0331 [Persephonella hydrogeniphila]|uniref:Uncharacterized protein n=1 Tax=Persephonella hydrogeniphila TaxID=198703 RepID=A0A285N1P0_9AQUI|nr:hypothetical protein [Persephonella hydrogeniphila]SNZ03248.1 hypothetical protein SAMN06265182_0331 [Persephonella hydrogeniphila]
MEFICWTPVIFSRSGFPRDEEGKPFLPKNLFIESITSAIIFYYIKKDREIENKLRNILLKEPLNIKNLGKKIKEAVLDKYPVLDQLYIPEKTYIPQKYIKTEYVEIFDLKKWIDIKGFKTEIFKGTVPIEIKSPYIEKIKAAAHSYAEALAKIEHSLLKGHPLSSYFYEPLINEIKKWDIPLRTGMWTEVAFRGDLLFFWRIKEVREKIMKELKTDIRPRYVLYLPKEKQTTGWTELKIK